MEPSTAIIDSAKYGKVPRSVGMAKKWEEISGGVWCCPVKVKAAIKDAATCTALACSLLGIFYPEEELKERRLHELDRDVVEAITEIPAGFGPGRKVPNTNALIHTSVELTCRPPGEPKPTICWLFNGSLNLKSNNRFCQMEI